VKTLRDPAEIDRPGADGTAALDRDDDTGAARDVSIDASDGGKASAGPRDGEWKRVGAAVATVCLEEVKPPSPPPRDCCAATRAQSMKEDSFFLRF